MGSACNDLPAKALFFLLGARQGKRKGECLERMAGKASLEPRSRRRTAHPRRTACDPDCGKGGEICTRRNKPRRKVQQIGVVVSMDLGASLQCWPRDWRFVLAGCHLTTGPIKARLNSASEGMRGGDEREGMRWEGGGNERSRMEERCEAR